MTSSDKSFSPTIAVLESLKAQAAAQLAAYPQYKGHFASFVLVKVKSTIRTKLGVALVAGELAIAEPSQKPVFSPNPFRFRNVYSISNKVTTSIPSYEVEEINLDAVLAYESASQGA